MPFARAHSSTHNSTSTVRAELAEEREHLASWLKIRNALITIWLVSALALYVTDFTQPALAALIVAALLAFINFTSHLRLANPLAVVPLELCSHYLLDITLLTGALFFCGAINNPFISLLLIPVSVAALALNRRQCFVIGGWAIGCYSLLFIGSDAAPATELFSSHHAHLIGMWLSFAVGACLLLIFVNNQARQARVASRNLQALQIEHQAQARVFDLALHSATISHNLATPLNNIQLLSDELGEYDLPTSARYDLEALQAQLQRCREYLQALRHDKSSDSAKSISLSSLIANLQSNVLLLHPNVTFSVDDNSENVEVPILLRDALENILQNAIAAGATQLRLVTEVKPTELRLSVTDNGRGLTQQEFDLLGHLPLSSKTGWGIGIFLTQRTLETIGATLSYAHAHPSGTCAQLSIPLDSINR